MTKNNAKKYFKAGVAAAVVVSSGVVVAPISSHASEVQSSITFSDLKQNDLYYTEVMNLVERGIVKGFPNNTYGTYKEVTRGQAAKILAGVLQLDTVNVTDPGFVDVPKESEYYGAIAALQNAGIIKGYTSDNTFRSGEPVTRNHMAKMIAIGFGLEASQSAPFTDINGEYKNYISALYEHGVTTGKTATSYDGRSSVKRGQMAAFAVRADDVKREVTLTINEVKESKIVTNKGQYKAALEIFNTENTSALENAEVKAVIKNGEVQEITSLTLNTSGTIENPVIFDGGNVTINGPLTINADYAAIKNLTVNGDVTLTGTVANDFLADGLVTNGELIIAEQAQAQVASLNMMFANAVANGPKVNLTNSSAKAIHAKRDHIAITSNTKLPEVKVASNVASIIVNAEVATVNVIGSEALQITGSGSIDKLNVPAATQLAIDVNGQVKELVLENQASKVSLGENVTVQKLVVPTGSNISTIVENYETVKGKITEVVEGTGSEVEPPAEEENPSGDGTPNDGGNTGGGGGINPPVADTIAPELVSVSPEAGKAVVVAHDGTFKLVVQAKDENLRELEIDHNLDLPEFSVYASAENPYGTDALKAAFEAQGVNVTFDATTKTWTIDFGATATNAIVSKGDVSFYLVLEDEAGNRFGNMNPTTSENTFTYTVTRAEAPVVKPQISIADLPQEVTTETKATEDANGKIEGFNPEGKTPIQVSLKKGNKDYSNVRVVVEGLDAGVQLIAQDTSGNWYNIAKTGWGPAEGFALQDATTPVYVIANTAGSYNANIKLVDVANENNILATTTASITAEAPVVAPQISIADLPQEVTTETKATEDANGKIEGFNPEGKTPIQVSLKKGNVDYSNVRVVVEGLNEGVQLIAQDTSGNWYNIAKTGWGPAEGFALLDATTPVYVVANTEGTYNATIKLVDVVNEKVLAASNATIEAVNTIEQFTTTLNMGENFVIENGLAKFN